VKDNDQLTAAGRLVLSALGALFPVRLAVGLALGFLVKTIVHVAATIQEQVLWRTLDEYNSIWYVIIVAPLLFIPVIIRSHGVPEQALHHINTIDLMITRSGLTPAQAQMMWRSLIEKYLASVQPDLSHPAPALDTLFEDTKHELRNTTDPPPNT
jgi:hypothetical protein